MKNAPHASEACAGVEPRGGPLRGEGAEASPEGRRMVKGAVHAERWRNSRRTVRLSGRTAERGERTLTEKERDSGGHPLS